MGHPTTGPIVVMMIKMFAEDVVLFLIIFSVFLIGFSLAFHVQFNELGWLSFALRSKSCFVTMLGDINFDAYMDPAQVQQPWLSTFFITIYVVVISVMLLNLLIAMMG